MTEHRAELDAMMRLGPGQEVVTVDDVVSMYLRRPRWQQRAACRGQGAASGHFPGLGSDTAPAKALCASCPVQDECRAYALEIDARDGIWAGQTAAQLRKAARAA